MESGGGGNRRRVRLLDESGGASPGPAQPPGSTGPEQLELGALPRVADAAVPSVPSAAVLKFWARAEKGPKCWLWRGGKDKDGYGRFVRDGSTIRAHRFAYLIAIGPIPPGKHVCHRCDTPACVRPEHLFLGSAAENMADRNAKGRQARGARNGRATMDEEAVREARRLLAGGMSCRGVADVLGVTQSAIQEISAGRNWKHVA